MDIKMMMRKFEQLANAEEAGKPKWDGETMSDVALSQRLPLLTVEQLEQMPPELFEALSSHLAAYQRKWKQEKVVSIDSLLQ